MHEDNAMTKTNVTNHQRRTFLNTAKIAGAAAVVAFISRKNSEPTPEVTPAKKDSVAKAEPSTYHETEHIRKYYRSAALM